MRTALLFFGTFCVGAGLVVVWRGGELAFESWDGQRQAQREWNAARLEVQPASAVTRQENRPQWTGGVIGRIAFPDLGEERFFLSDQNPKNLERGPVWLAETSGPGMRGNCVIAGHRDTHFRFLRHIAKGQEILVEDQRVQYRYRVQSVHIVGKTNNRLLARTSQPMLTLVTCYPFYFVGPAPRRFLVRAALVDVRSLDESIQRREAD